MPYFILKNNKTHGPFTKSQIENGLNNGKLTGEELFSDEPTGPWQKVDQLSSDLFPPRVETVASRCKIDESDIDSTDGDEAITSATTSSACAEAVDEVASVPKTIVCPDCDGTVSKRARSCPHCGGPMEGSNITPVKPSAENSPAKTNIDESLNAWQPSPEFIQEQGSWWQKLSDDKKTGIKIGGGFFAPLAALTLIALVVASVSSQETVDFKDLDTRNGIKYKKNSDVPFSGIVVLYFNNGQQKIKDHYRNGILNGMTTEWYEDGQKREVVKWKDGKRNGLTTGWHYNGKKRWEGTYKDGNLEGPFIAWHPNGQKLAEVTYKDGELIKTEMFDQ